MKILVNNLDEFVNFHRGYYKDLIEAYSKNPTENNNDVRIKILNEPYIKNRKKIIKEELKEVLKESPIIPWLFENPYRICVWDDDKKYILIEWEEEIFDITIEKLVELLKKSNKKYLVLRNGSYGYLGKQRIVEIEI